jgi:hypothetical protein
MNDVCEDRSVFHYGWTASGVIFARLEFSRHCLLPRLLVTVGGIAPIGHPCRIHGVTIAVKSHPGLPLILWMWLDADAAREM